MAFTKLYLGFVLPHTPIRPSSKQGTWDAHGPTTNRFKLQSAKNKDNKTPSGTFAFSETQAAAGWRVCLYESISPPISAQTISGTVDIVAQTRESNAAADFHWRVHIVVLEGDTNNVRGVLLDGYEEAAGVNEWPTTRTGIALNSPQTLSSVSAQDGDRIKVELGYISRNSVTTSFSGSLYPGTGLQSASVVDMTVGSTATNAISFVEFSNSITTPAAPANDNCASPTVISSLPFSDSQNIEWATEEAGDPIVASLERKAYCTVWYEFTPASSGRYKFDYQSSNFVGDPFNGNLTGVVAIYTGSCGSLTEVKSKHGVGALTADLVGGTKYLILVGSSEGSGGDLVFNVSEVAAPYPTNISPETAQEITTLPTEFTVDISKTTGPEHELWFKYTGRTNELVIGVLAWAPWGTSFANYRPNISVWTGAPGSLTEWLPDFPIARTNTPIVVPVVEDQDFYFKVIHSSLTVDATASSTLTMSFVPQPNEAVPAGSFLINDDTTGFPTAIISSSTGEVLRYIDMPAGENGVITPSAIVLEDVNQITGQVSAVWHTSEGVEYASWPYPTTNHVTTGYTVDAEENIYIGIKTGSELTDVRKFDLNANIVGGPWQLPNALDVESPIAVNREGTILYYIRAGSLGAPIRRFDLVNEVALADFASAPANYRAGFEDMFVLSDGSVLLRWHKSTNPTDSFIRHYASDGSTIRDFQIGTPGVFVRFTLDSIENPTKIIVWNQPASTGITRHEFKIFNISTGALEDTITIDGRFSQGEATWNSDFFSDIESQPRFGPSPSCPILTLTSALSGGAGFEPPPAEPGDPDAQTCPCVEGTVDQTTPEPPPEFMNPIIGPQLLCVGGGLVPDGPDPVWAETWWGV